MYQLSVTVPPDDPPPPHPAATASANALSASPMRGSRGLRGDPVLTPGSELPRAFTYQTSGMLPASTRYQGGLMSVADRRARFHELHAREGIFVMPNPWDIGSARILQSCGFEALATTSAGYAWLLGKDDHQVTRDELVAHVAELAAAVDVPLSVDSERCFSNDAGVAETVRLLADAGAAGCSIEDWDPETGRIDDPGHSTELVAAAVEAAHDRPDPLVLTARA